MERLLVIGCSGLLGGRLMALGKERYEMFGTYNTHEVKGQNTHKLDILDRQGVFRLMEKIKPDCVMDAASLTGVDYCETHKEETWKVNVEGPKNLAEACRDHGCKYVYTSTAAVFDGTKLRYTEKDKPHPLNYYAKTKLISECVLSALDLNYLIARTDVLYGVGGSGKVSFPTWLINELRAKRRVKIVSDQHNGPTFADNLAEFLFKLYEKDARGIFHITGKECVSRLDFARAIARLFNLESSLMTPVTSPELNQVAMRPRYLNLSTDKAERVAGMKTLTVMEGLQMFKSQLAKQ